MYTKAATLFSFRNLLPFKEFHSNLFELIEYNISKKCLNQVIDFQKELQLSDIIFHIYNVNLVEEPYQGLQALIMSCFEPQFLNPSIN